MKNTQGISLLGLSTLLFSSGLLLPMEPGSVKQVFESLTKKTDPANAARQVVKKIIDSGDQASVLMEELIECDEEGLRGITKWHKMRLDRVDYPTARTPLHEAVGQYNSKTKTYYSNDILAQWLIEHGADVTAEDGIGLTPLHESCSAISTELLIQKGADVNVCLDCCGTPLNRAVIHNAPEAVAVLLNHNADPNIIIPYENDTAIFHVQDKTILKSLLKKGSRVDLINKQGQTCLHTILRRVEDKSDASDIIRQLHVRDNTLIHKPDNDGNYPLHIAAFTGNQEAVRTLLELGASPLVSNNEGRSPQDIAGLIYRPYFNQEQRQEVCTLLESAYKKYWIGKRLVAGSLKLLKNYWQSIS